MQEQSISFQGREIDNPKATISDYGMGQDSMVLLRRKVVVAGRFNHCHISKHTPYGSTSRSTEQDSEMMRLQLLGDANLMQEIRGVRVIYIASE